MYHQSVSHINQSSVAKLIIHYRKLRLFKKDDTESHCRKGYPLHYLNQTWLLLVFISWVSFD